MKVSLVQGNIAWHQPHENIRHFSELVNAIDETDLIILPEMWISGFTMKAHQHHKDYKDGLAQMHNWSLKHDALVMGSLIVKENELYYNRMLLVENGEIVAAYDKRHLFGFAGEDRYFTPGTEKIIYEYQDWKICPMICYDLRFPAWCRNLENYDLLVFSANWPDKRANAWNALLKARAIENQAFVAGVTCYGEDVWDNTYSGSSRLFSYDGTEVAAVGSMAGVITTEIRREPMLEYREKLPFLKDRDAYTIR